MEIKEREETVVEPKVLSDALTRTLLIEDQDGEIRVTIPETWKVTLGALQPGMDHSPTLRIYEAENKQRAMFRNVVCFRDLSIKVERSRIEGDNVVWEEADDTFRLSPAPRSPRNPY